VAVIALDAGASSRLTAMVLPGVCVGRALANKRLEAAGRFRD